jgi:hypothetical protein
MKIGATPVLRAAVVLVVALCQMTGIAPAQSVPTVADRGPSTCSPAPCVLTPTQASEGGAEVADAPIVADPLNPTHLLLGSVDFNCEFGPGFFTSSDSGSSWNRTCLTQAIGPYLPGDYPMVGYDRSGVAYSAAQYVHHTSVNFGLVAIQRSTDGVNWSQPITALKEGESPYYPWLAVDTSVGSPYLNNLYISAVIASADGANNRIYVSHSSDGGVTWQAVAVAPGQVFPKEDFYTNVTTAKDGTVYLTWMYCDSIGNGFCGSKKIAYMVFSKSSDGGNTWSKPRSMAKVTLLPSLLPNANVPVTNIPVVGIDNSNGPHSGNLYVVMYNWTGTFMQVQVIRSTDGGNTWSKPVPVATASDTHDQFFPWLSVSNTGLVGVSWLDRRNDPANIDYQAFAAISTDGGLSFQPNVQLTTAFSNPNVNGYVNNDWMGDYTGNTWAGPDFVAAWMDSSNGVDMQDLVGGIRLH